MKLSLIHKLTIPLPELEKYYREQRRIRFERGQQPNAIHFRKQCYPLFRTFLALDRLFRRQTIAVINSPPKVKKQVIFACTHIGENDLENIYEQMGQGCWWFVGDPCFMYRNISGLFTYLNGVIFLDTEDKTDRHIAYLRAVELLKAGGSLMIYPEGARNGSEHLPVMPLFLGTANMAMETGTHIVPVAIEQYDKRFVINFGNEISPNDFQNSNDLSDHLRDALATLKWSIWEKEELQFRADIPCDYNEQFTKEFAKRLYPYDTLTSVERTRYHTKAELEQRDAFLHLSKLIVGKENAFLFRKQ